MDIFLNWLWRGAVVAAAAHLLLWGFGPLMPRTRYRVWWAALALTLALPLLPRLNDAWVPASASAAIAERVAPLVSLPESTSVMSLALVLAWAAWIVIMGGRTLVAALSTRRVKQRVAALPADLESRLARWSALRRDGRRTRLVTSSDVRLAAVLGVGSPVIAVSPALLERLSPDDLDRVVVHEWAHVQRRDDFANALQLAIRGVAGWHPAAWWIGRQLDLEREIACDAQAIAITGGARPYACCLATLAGLSTRETALPVPAALKSSNIRRRVSRILSLGDARTGWWARCAAAVSTGALCVLAASAASINLVDVYAAEVSALLQGRSFTLPNLRTPGAGASFVGAAAPQADAGSGAPAARREAQAQAGPAANLPATLPLERVAPAPPAAPATPATVMPATPVPMPPSTDSAAPVAELLPSVAVPLPTPPLAPAKTESTVWPWTAAADAGVAVGAGSTKAAVATAGFFTRFGKSVARTF